jgi:NADPH-dependent glutamate synthase beta subunit-like oxidoreductase/NAD(P)H-flavin reductase
MSTSTPATSKTQTLKINLRGYSYEDLYNPFKLKELTDIFYQGVEADDPELYASFKAYAEAKGEGWDPVQTSSILVRMGPYLSRFIAKMFGVEDERARVAAWTADEMTVQKIKRDFVMRRAVKKVKQDDAAVLDLKAIEGDVALIASRFPGLPADDREMAMGKLIAACLEEEKAKRDGSGAVMATLERWASGHFHQRPADTAKWTMFMTPQPIDYGHLVEFVHNPSMPGAMIGHEEEYRRRDGFKLTDRRYSDRQISYEVEYCVFCHDRDRDSCAKGFYDKSGKVLKNSVGIELTGCPLHEKISEAQYLKGQGDPLAALAVIVVDNPMAAGTGHRICNDCMKACIYTKKDPVNIPQIETRILTTVLELPYGFEIYALLTRWNPLNVKRPYALPYNGKNVLVAGLGPAGYTLSHFLLNEGFGVVGIDGLKVEPVFAEYIGGNGVAPKPIRDWSEIYRELDARVLEGFGGVSEYGITVRWDKNFLTTLHIILARRDRFKLYGGTRFGGTVKIEDAWELGFDHIAIATGAGKPTIVPMKNNLIRGIKKASDFLMANLQIQLPAVVIGGGLTGIDTATELIAYYPTQVTKFAGRYHEICGSGLEEEFWKRLDAEETVIAKKFLAHADEVTAERARANAAGELPNFIPLVRKWGGVKLVYRKRMLDAPAYRLNHEEIIKAFEEGIEFVEGYSPTEAVADEFGAVKEMRFEHQILNDAGKWRGTGEITVFPAKCVMVAAGTSPNIIYEREHPGTFVLDEWREFFLGHKLEVGADGKLVPVPVSKGETGFFTSYHHDGKFISFYGDNHPVYMGNVVKAMASARDGFSHVVGLFTDAVATAVSDAHRNGQGPSVDFIARNAKWNSLAVTLDSALLPRVHSVTRLTQTITEVIVHAPYAAKHFRPGQFFRLQNYEVNAPRANGVPLAMEGLALTGAWTDVGNGLLSMIVLEMGGSSNLVAALKKDENVVVMGPTGEPTEIPQNETVLLLGGGLGNAVLFSIAKALKENGNKVIYFAGYKKGEDLFKQDEVEINTDQVIWSTDMGAEIKPRRPQDAHIRANIVQAMLAYQGGKLADRRYPLETVNRIIAIGSDRMMAAVKEARHAALAPFLREHVAIASINSTMQCMMKEICAQCLQRHVDPVTGKETFVFSCFNQDQVMDSVDFASLNNRLKANSVLEKLTVLWLGNTISVNGIPRI